MAGVGEYVMSWPILLPREMTVADMLGMANADLLGALRSHELEPDGPPAWALGVVRGRLTLTGKISVTAAPPKRVPGQPRVATPEGLPPLAPGERRPCGTHAAYVRHKKAGEEPCGDCRTAERKYQRERMARSRAEGKAVA